ncbi:MAG: hypothetical protein MUC96_35340 [Myxococcaceae bacterium]|jgi:hypothetical protein|nr:hypothetical protein [Myxococcaceae bacterium]
MTWSRWRAHFDANAHRPLPPVTPPVLDDARRLALARSLARFQLGESGEGRIAHDIDRATFEGIDDDYRAALKRFVAEEGRHARLLGEMVAALGGTLEARHWSQRLFTHARRLFGIRFKLLVLQAAEVVALAFYGALARALPASNLRWALEAICDDERQHLAFHRDFFRGQPAGVQGVLGVVWWPLVTVAVGLTLLDHREVLRVFSVSPRQVWALAWAHLVAPQGHALEATPR